MIPESLARAPVPLAAALHERGFTHLTPVQEAVLQALEGSQDDKARDLRISSQTGSGKTVAFGIALAPQLLRKGRKQAATEALVIVPTRELVAQVSDELRWLYRGVPHLQVEGVMGGAPLFRERRALEQRPAILVATPGRLLDHIRAGALACEKISQVVLDEADRMLDMGFREELDAIVEALPQPRRSHLASATFPASVKRLADRLQSNPLRIEAAGEEDTHPDIAHIAHLVRSHERYAALVNLLLLARGTRSLVFVQRRADATDISERLAADGLSAQPLSGELPQAQRTRTLKAFRNGSVEILIATDVAARGIDVPDIATVIHLDTPFDPETYVHRSGRTGRAGSQGRSLMLVATSQERRMRRLLQIARIEAEWRPAPGAPQILKSVRKEQRRTLRRNLESGADLQEKQLEYATRLLAEHDPARVVATLLEMSTPALPCEPKALSDATRLARDSRDGREKGATGRSSGGRAQKRARDFVTFSLSWGHRKGATTASVLSQVCRRGHVSGQLIGAIEVEAQRSTFQVASEVADAFEARVGRPDDRDPGVRIERLGAGELPPRARRGRAPFGARKPRRSPSRGHETSTGPSKRAAAPA